MNRFRWKVHPIPTYVGSAPSEYFSNRVRHGITWHKERFAIVDRTPDVGIDILYAERDPYDRRVHGGAWGWHHHNGNALLFQRAWICLHPHLVPHRINEVTAHELGHVVGEDDNVKSAGTIMDDRLFLGGSWDPRSDCTQMHNEGVRLLDNNTREGVEVLGRAVTIAVTELFHDKKAVATTYTSLASGYNRLGDDAAAEEALSRAVLLTDDIDQLGRIHLDRARAIAGLHGLRKALPHFRLARRAAMKTNNYETQASVAHHVALELGAKGRRRIATRFHLAAHDFYSMAGEHKEDQRRKEIAAQASNSLMLAHISKGNLKSALEVLELHEPAFTFHPFLHAGAWNNFAHSCMHERKWREAAFSFEASMKIFMTMGNDAVPLEILEDMAWCFLAAGEANFAVRRLLAAVVAAWERNHGDGIKARYCVMFDFFCKHTGYKDHSLSSDYRAALERVSARDLEPVNEELRARVDFFLR